MNGAGSTDKGRADDAGSSRRTSAAEGGRDGYEAPRLTEWGSIHALTRGLQAGSEDFPSLGGSQGV